MTPAEFALLLTIWKHQAKTFCQDFFIEIPTCVEDVMDTARDEGSLVRARLIYFDELEEYYENQAR